MKTTIIVEGEFDKNLLNLLLKGRIDGRLFTIYKANGKSSATSIARTMLATSSAPLAFVEDADTTDEGRIADQKGTLEYLLRLARGTGKFSVFLAVPSLESALFVDPKLGAKIAGRKLTEEERIRSRFEPKKVLSELVKSPENALKKINSSDLKNVDVPLVRDLIAFIQSNARAHAA